MLIPQSKSPQMRCGSAALEFVLALPFLLALVAMIFAIGTAALTKSASAIQAREASWSQRANSEEKEALHIFSTECDEDKGIITKPVTNTSKLPPIVDAAFRRTNLTSATAISSNPVLTETWNNPYHNAEFLVPHTDALSDFVYDAQYALKKGVQVGTISERHDHVPNHFRLVAFQVKANGSSLASNSNVSIKALIEQLGMFKSQFNFNVVSQDARSEFAPQFKQYKISGLEQKAKEFLGGSAKKLIDRVNGRLDEAQQFTTFEDADSAISAVEDLKKDLREIEKQLGKLLDNLKPKSGLTPPNPTKVMGGVELYKIEAINNRAMKTHLRFQVSIVEKFLEQVFGQEIKEVSKWLRKIDDAGSKSHKPDLSFDKLDMKKPQPPK